ncbi:MAG TPA: hypothetical protein ENN21_05615 [Spirochaetes bacterium]|nr:hypothetical protein [Spirochaetota bacterium]
MRTAVILLCVTAFAYLIKINNYLSDHFIDPLDYKAAARLEKDINRHRALTPPLYKNIMLLVLDGVTADLFYDPAMTPVVHGYLARGGLKCETAYAALPSVSAPNYYTILSGAPPFLHGVTGNDRRYAARGKVKNIFNYLEDAGLNTACAAFEWYHELIGNSSSVYIPVECCERDDTPGIVDALLRLVTTKTLPYFTFAHFLAPDNAAHATGSNNSRRYREALRTIDTELGRLLPRLDLLYPDTLVIIMADHGMNLDGNHGGSDRASLRIPLVFLPPAGRPFQPGAGTIHREIYNLDIAPTIAALSGLPVPVFSAGSIVHEIYTGPSALDLAHESIDRKEHLLRLMDGRGGRSFAVTEDPRPGARLHDRALGEKIMGLPDAAAARVLRAQRMAAAALSLLFVLWVIYRSPAGMPALLGLNGLIVLGINFTSHLLESRHLYDIALAVLLPAVALMIYLFLRHILDPAMELKLRARFGFGKIMFPLLVETLLLAAFFVPFYTKTTDPHIFSFRFFSLSFIIPFAVTGALFLHTLLKRRSYLLA